MPILDDIAGQLGEASAEVSACQALVNEAAERVDSAYRLLGGVLDGSNDESAQNAVGGFVAAQSLLYEAVPGQLIAGQAGIEEFLAHLTRGTSSAGPNAPVSIPSPARGKEPADSGTSTRKRIRKVEPKGYLREYVATYHFEDHGKNLGVGSVEEYVESAKDFLRRAQEYNYPARIDDDGRLRIFDPGTNTFGSFDAQSGHVITYYKPKSPTYWERNVAKWGDEVSWE